ncbi:hypothetical protein QBC46DRAFT_384937 [Diplogelasinospora grovesii]|uniref:N-acetyltransferase domain-containing protein n=1 Tax=Diplogelasinospora grovesii TaxID=303347 RepID=A0AAN6S4X8_9PEZI|nr:hypothetical protein QBC46DRAFT_384937 [Diplogelasinospora grovesii]
MHTDPTKMSRAQQTSIRSFFQTRPEANYATPPSASPDGGGSVDGAPPRAFNNGPTASGVAPAPASTVGESQQPPSPLVNVSLPAAGVPVLPSPPSLPARAKIVPLEAHHIPALRRINTLLLPVAYPDSFYAKALEPLASGLFSRAILWQDDDHDNGGNTGAKEPKVIGGIVCRLEPNIFVDATNGQPRQMLLQQIQTYREPPTTIPDSRYHAIYIQSLTLLAPYRSVGLAAAALEHVVASAAVLPAAGSSIDVRTIYAHVWTENEEGLRWYAARGFAPEGPEPVRGYYFKLRPDTAWLVRRQTGPGATPLSLPPSRSSLPPGPAATTVGTGTGTGTRMGMGMVTAAAVNLPPPPGWSGASATRPQLSTTSSSASGLSFQNARPETEWNDLPLEMVAPVVSGSRSLHLSPPSGNTPASGSGPASGASSRSSSTARNKKKERAYPAAAFGNN